MNNKNLRKLWKAQYRAEQFLHFSKLIFQKLLAWNSAVPQHCELADKSNEHSLPQLIAFKGL